MFCVVKRPHPLDSLYKYSWMSSFFFPFVPLTQGSFWLVGGFFPIFFFILLFHFFSLHILSIYLDVYVFYETIRVVDIKQPSYTRQRFSCCCCCCTWKKGWIEKTKKKNLTKGRWGICMGMYECVVCSTMR